LCKNQVNFSGFHRWWLDQNGDLDSQISSLNPKLTCRRSTAEAANTVGVGPGAMLGICLNLFI
jgi:hypothetical protein